MTFRVTWYELGWWHEERFPDRDQAEVFAIDKSLERRTEARLFVGGVWTLTFRQGEQIARE